ncbi:MAG: peptidoglycan DD-metalloendopeptidase family protein [Alteromonadaceae bacterium]|nr:peptidoglycan DD-metalloendopeptidase family protein [Alteromonadaceae bacterium]
MNLYRTKIKWRLKWGKKGICWCLLSLLLISCSNRNTPAPVVSVKGSVPLNQRVKNSIAATEYYVKSGETLYSIAWRSDVDVRTIAKLNKISSPYKIYPGQKLILSAKLSSQIPQVNQTNSSTKKQNKNSSLKIDKQTKKAVAQNKKQEYGKSRSEEKVNKNPSWPLTKFSKKIRKWQWPAKGRIVATYSTAIQGNKGIDIAGKRGDKVKAAAGGKVVYAGDALRGYGKLVIIKHNDDYLSAYAHNDKILVEEQQLVKAGELIANMGKTDAKRVMLHFEVRFRGKSVNPMKYLPKK